MRKLEDIINELKPIKKNGYSHNDSKYLLKIPASERSEEVVEILMKQHSKLARSIAKKEWKKYSNYVGTILEYEDILSVANYGLLKAINKYNYLYNTEFSTYALHWIRQVVVREIENGIGIARIPIHFQQTMHKYDHGFIKNEKERIMIEKIKMTIIDYSSIDIPIHNGSDECNVKDILTYKGTMNQIKVNNYDNPEYQFLRKYIRIRLLDSFKIIKNTRNIEILKLRFGLNDFNEIHTLESISAIYGMTRERVRQICDKYIEKIIRSKVFKESDMAVF